MPKKNSLFLRIGPPILPPKSFSLTILRGRLRALLDQVIGVEVGVLEIIEQAAVEFVVAAAGDQGDAHGGYAVAAEIELRGLDSHLGDVFDARLDDGSAVGEATAAEAVADGLRAIELGATHGAARQIVEGSGGADAGGGDSSGGPSGSEQGQGKHVAALQRRG